VHNPTDPGGRLLFNVLGMVAEFERDSPAQERYMVALPRAGNHTVTEPVELFGVGRATVYRALERHSAAVDLAATLPCADA